MVLGGVVAPWEERLLVQDDVNCSCKLPGLYTTDLDDTSGQRL